MLTAWRSVGVLLLVGVLCGVAWAGNVSVEVKDGGAAVAGALVKIEPGGASGTTNAAGKWTAPGVAAGTYRVISWKIIGGALRGGITDVVVPAAGNVSVTVNYSDAIWTYDYFPFGVGNRWQYRMKRVSAAGTEAKTRREHVDRAVDVGGEPAVAIIATSDGVMDWEEIRASTRDGFVMYTTQHGADTMTFDPPIRIGPLLPLGYEWALTSTIKHSDGSPDSPTQMTVQLVGFNDITVPAGTFPHAARLQVVQTMGPEADNITAWVGRGVGIVREIETNPERTNTKLLEEYHIIALPARPLLRPIRPVLPH